VVALRWLDSLSSGPIPQKADRIRLNLCSSSSMSPINILGPELLNQFYAGTINVIRRTNPKQAIVVEPECLSIASACGAERSNKGPVEC
jgi:hypothetical protein